MKNHRLQSSQGQNLIELSVLTVLVLIGILVMGPYVIRSWNARLALQDGALRDTYRDSLDWTDVNIEIPDCACEWKLPDFCDPLCCGLGDCTEFEQSYFWECTPVGCDTIDDPWQCEDNENCCSPWVPIGCGVNANDIICGPPFGGCGDTGGPHNPCHIGTPTYGEQGYQRFCGNANPENAEFKCVVDEICIFDCTGTIAPGLGCHNDMCVDNDDIPDNEGLPGNMSWRSRDGVPYNTDNHPDGCTETRKCEVHCTGDYIVGGGGSRCECPCNWEPTGGCGNANCKCPPNMEEDTSGAFCANSDKRPCVCKDGWYMIQGSCWRIKAHNGWHCDIGGPWGWYRHDMTYCQSGWVNLRNAFPGNWCQIVKNVTGVPSGSTTPFADGCYTAPANAAPCWHGKAGWDECCYFVCGKP